MQTERRGRVPEWPRVRRWPGRSAGRRRKARNAAARRRHRSTLGARIHLSLSMTQRDVLKYEQNTHTRFDVRSQPNYRSLSLLRPLIFFGPQLPIPNQASPILLCTFHRCAPQARAGIGATDDAPSHREACSLHLMLAYLDQKATDSVYFSRSSGTPLPPSSLPSALRIIVTVRGAGGTR